MTEHTTRDREAVGLARAFLRLAAELERQERAEREGTGAPTTKDQAGEPTHDEL